MSDADAADGRAPLAASTTPAVSPRARRAAGALMRYRVMAYVTGSMLLLLCVELVLRHVLHGPDALVSALVWVPFAHGWIYVVYLVTVMDLWSVLRWKFGRLVTMALAGVVQVMSFVLERRVHAQGDAAIAAMTLA